MTTAQMQAANAQIIAQLKVQNAAISALLNTTSVNSLPGSIAALQSSQLATINTLMTTIYTGYVLNPVIPPTPPPSTYSETARYALARNAYKATEMGLTVGQSCTTFVASKGTTMPFGQYSTPLLGFPYYTADGMIYFPNTASCGYKLATANAPVLREIWIVMQKSNYYEYEGWMNLYDCTYLGELGGTGIRTQSQSTQPVSQWQIPTYVVPQNKPMIIRYQVLSLPNPNSGNPAIQLTINGTVLGSGLTTAPIKSNTFGLGTDGPGFPGDAQGANCAQMGVYEFLEFSPLSDANAAIVLAELEATYPYQTTQYPFASNITISHSGGNTVANYTYNGNGVSEDLTKRVVRWINSTNPTVSEYIGSPSNSLTLTGQTLTNGRVEITCFDTNGKSLGIPQSVTIGT